MNVQRLLSLAGALLVGALLAVATLQPVTATHQPADKMAVASSVLEVAGPAEEVTLLTGTMRTSSPTDLILTLSMECSIMTEVTTVGNDESEASSRIEAWIEIDGEPVGVVGGDDGKVVFCDRTHRQTTSLFDDDDATIQSYLRTRSSHSFSWVDLNLGKGLHTIEVKATLTASATDGAFAEGYIGKRTLVVEPTKLANDVVV